MKTFATIADIRAARWEDPLASWGLVPTMGYLHDGHLSLVRQAKADNDRVGVSIFVNPMQFNNPQDLANYPRNMETDLALLAAEGVDLVWTPTPEIMYPQGFETHVMVEKLTRGHEGLSRPGHFKGVATVVAKLFNVFEPRRTYFGQKDAQQAIVVQRMAKDLDFNLEVVVCATVREPDGLAMSSRNARLTPHGRQQATCLYRALMLAKSAYDQGQRDAVVLRAMILEELASVPEATVDYVSIADAQALVELSAIENRALVSMAVIIDGIRLLDNIVLD